MSLHVRINPPLGALNVFDAQASFECAILFEVCACILLEEDIGESAFACSGCLQHHIIEAIADAAERAVVDVRANEGTVLDD
jgi:hypothetical protein